jgi:probable HAF family extracellular repeat protein
MLAAASSWAAAPSYTSIEIRSPAGTGGNVIAAAVNRYGDVVGSYSSAAGIRPATSGAFVYYHRSGSEVTLTPTASAASLLANGINDQDLVVGSQSGPSIGVEPIEWSKNGGVQILPVNDLALASADDNTGNVIGNIDNGHGDNLAVMWTGPTHKLTELGVLWVDPTLPGYASSTASALNSHDHVAGFSFAGRGNTPDTAEALGVHAFLYRGGKMLDLGGLAPSAPDNDSEGYGINNLDEVVGLSSTTIPARNSLGQSCSSCGVASHAFLWRAGKMTDLGNLASIPGWDSKADAIDDRGEIVGWSDSNVSGAATHRAFLYAGGQMLNLQFYIFDRDPNVRLTEAVGINCAGWIVVNGFNVKTPNVSRAYLLIPRGPPRPCT